MLTIKKFETEALPRWQTAHPGKKCPTNIAELYELADSDGKDPWGKPYRFTCDAPTVGTGRLTVLSSGPDGRGDTADDISSAK